MLQCINCNWCNNDLIYKFFLAVMTINSINKRNPIYRTGCFY